MYLTLSDFTIGTDVGGIIELMGKKVDIADVSLSFWEQQTHALLVSLVSKKQFTVDELRRYIESFDPEHYESW
jgi:hypothetical protein